MRIVRRFAFRLYQRILRRFGGFGLSRLSAIQRLDSWIYNNLKSQYAIVLGKRIYVGPRDHLDLSLNNVYEPLATELVKQIVFSGDHVLDVGANIGYYTILLSDLVGETGQVHACEPEELNLRILRENVEQNQLKNVQILDYALGDFDGQSEIHVFPGNRGMNRLWNTHHTETDSIQIIRVFRAENTTELQDAALDFVKLDVEGFEFRALSAFKKEQFSPDGHILLIEYSPDYLRQADSVPASFLNFLFADEPTCIAMDENGSRYWQVNANGVHRLLEELSIGQVNCMFFYGDKKKRLEIAANNIALNYL